MRHFLFAAIFLLCCLSAVGQEPALADSVPGFEEPNIIVLSDTIDFTTIFPVWDVESYSKHSPAKAAIMSAVLPGLGQIYNKKYWKLPIVYAAVGISAGVFIHWQNEYNRFRRAYIDIRDGDPYTNYHRTIPNFPPNVSDSEMLPYISRHKDRLRTYRDWSIVALFIAYAANIVDANVDAHLIDFDISDNISLNIKPSFLGNGFDSQKFALSLRLSF